MRRLTGSILVLSALASLATPAMATPNVFLSSPNDLTHLTVGQVVTVDVNLQGLPVNQDFIFNLNTKVLFSSALFSPVADATPSGLTATYGSGSGSVFLYASQVTGFQSLSSLNSGSAVGIFAPPYPAISENGVYYSFKLKATSAGNGSIAFDSTPTANEYAADDTGFNYAPLPTGGPLNVNISAVPELSSLNLFVTLIAGGSGLLLRRKARKSK